MRSNVNMVSSQLIYMSVSASHHPCISMQIKLHYHIHLFLENIYFEFKWSRPRICNRCTQPDSAHYTIRIQHNTLFVTTSSSAFHNSVTVSNWHYSPTKEVFRTRQRRNCQSNSFTNTLIFQNYLNPLQLIIYISYENHFWSRKDYNQVLEAKSS